MVIDNMAPVDSNELQAPDKPKPTIGEEFVNWAEKFWGLDKVYKTKKKPANENAAYITMRPIFIKKINDLIQERLTS